MHGGLLWSLIPDEALPLLIVGIGFLVMFVGRRAIGLLVPIVLSLLLAPFISSVIGRLPPFVALLLFIGFALAVLRALAGFVLGDRAMGHMTGVLAADVVRFMFRLLFLPFRIIGWALRRRPNTPHL